MSENASGWSTWEEREAARPRMLAIIARMEEARRGPYVRTRPRNPDEAALLRAKGVPERLIGPDAPRGPGDVPGPQGPVA